MSLTQLMHVLLTAAICTAAALGSSLCTQPLCQSTELLAEFVSVAYDWEGSGFLNAADATSRGAFIVENNIITGVSAYNGTVFVCVPRWRSGVPSTLNTLHVNATSGTPYLRPFPNWEWQSTVLHYVQAVYVDVARGRLWIIDTGRENFMDSNPATLQNRGAALYVMDLSTQAILYNVSFPDSIFPFNSSFLNDIRVDPISGTRAYMTDTNTAGLGAIVAVDVATGLMRRIENNFTRAQPGYVVDVGGVLFPAVQSPSDGIALSADGSTLLFSVITGSRIFAVSTSMLLDFSVPLDDIAAATRILVDKGTSSDGMDWIDIPGSQQSLVIYGDFVSDGISALELDGTFSPAAGDVAVSLGSSRRALEWVDTIVAQHIPTTDQIDVYFTSNRLPQYIFHNMSFSGLDGPNMRVWRMALSLSRGGQTITPNDENAPRWALIVMGILGALLGASVAIAIGLRTRLRRTAQFAGSTASFAAVNRESAPLVSGLPR